MIKLKVIDSYEGLWSVKPHLITLDQFYPNIGDWYDRKVLNAPGPDNVALGAYDGDDLVGFLLGKRGVEQKVRCIRVFPEYQSSGLGIKLLDKGMDLVGTDKPLVTVSEELLHQYSRIFINRYGYELNAVEKHLYRRGKLEYIFNGSLN